MMVLAMFIMLVVLVIYIARDKSGKVMLTLLYNALVLFAAVVLLGMHVDPYVIGWISFGLISLLTLFYQNGVNEKTKASFISLVIIMGILTVLVLFLCDRAGICGLNSKTAVEDEVSVLDLHIRVNMVGVTYVVIMLGLIGTVKDSAMAVATGLYEVNEKNPGLSQHELFASGMNIGRDINGVTINTLLFAAIGESMLMVQMYFDCNYTFAQLINAKSLFQEVVLMLVGGLGVELSVPITSAITAMLMNRSVFSDR